MSNNAVDLILKVLILRKYLSFFDLLYDPIDKFKAFPVLSLYSSFILQINICLHIRRLLTFAL